MSLNASLDTILTNIANREQAREQLYEYDNDYAEKAFQKKYKLLKKYALLNPINLAKNINCGDIIRYCKSFGGKLSCCATVISIQYGISQTTLKIDKSIIDHISLQKNYFKTNNKFWSIWPAQYYIFKHVGPTAKEEKRALYLEKLHKNVCEKAGITGKKIINIDVPNSFIDSLLQEAKENNEAKNKKVKVKKKNKQI
jgi:hypothetical protein